MKNIQSVIIIIIILVGGYFLLAKKDSNIVSNTNTNTSTQASIKGCYVSGLAKDVYTLNITAQDGDVVSGTLAFKNFEKDSSSGTFVGTYKDGILLGDYSFDSEGMHSVMQVIFKKEGNSFVRGFGPVITVGERVTFTNTNDITYDPNQTFVLSATCE